MYSTSSIKFKMASNLSLNSNDSDVFYVEQPSNDQSLPRPNTPIVVHSTEMSGNITREMISISSIASPEPQIATINDDSNEPTMPYAFGRQLPIIPPSLNNLNLPPNPFNILATMAVVNREDGYDDNYSPKSAEPSVQSPISAPPMNVSNFDSRETPHTTTDDNTFYCSDEPRRIYFFPSSPSPPLSTLRKMKRKLAMGMSYPEKRWVSQHACEACGQMLPPAKDIPGPSNEN